MVRISAILLGAGESKRMGTNKLFLPWGRKTIFEQCLGTLLRSKVKEVIVVINERIVGKVNGLKDRKVKVVTNPSYKRGMSTSIRIGIKVMDPKSRGILIALGDQPFLKARTIDALLKAFSHWKGGIIVPSFRGKRGHPVIFHRRYEKKLLKLIGDMGGRSILEDHPEGVKAVRVKSEGVVKDIDTWEDYHPSSLSLPTGDCAAMGTTKQKRSGHLEGCQIIK